MVPAVTRHITVSAVPKGSTFRIVTVCEGISGGTAVGVLGKKRERGPRVCGKGGRPVGNLHDEQHSFVCFHVAY